MHVCRRMYDCIVLESTNLPAGVTLPAILEGCDRKEVALILDAIPDTANVQTEDIEAAGDFLRSPTPFHQ